MLEHKSWRTEVLSALRQVLLSASIYIRAYLRIPIMVYLPYAGGYKLSDH